MVLLLLIVILALAGGFLGNLLELALWIILAMAVAGALIAFFVYRWVKELL